ncbi:MAG: HU family DNA-binding protein [Aquificaceae bacterium]
MHSNHFPNFSKRKVSSMVNFLINSMREALISGENVKISGFGTFRKRQRRIVFKPSKKLLWKLKSDLKRSKM